MIIDASIPQQSYIEDCEVCCNPIQISSTFEQGKLTCFFSESIEQ